MLAFVLSMFGCRRADLRPAALRQGPPAEADARDARALLDSALATMGHRDEWLAFGQVEVELVDTWRSGLIRRLTPLPRNSERLLARFATDWGGDVTLAFAEGPSANTVWATRGGALFDITDGEPGEPMNISSTRLFLESVQFYLELPMALGGADAVAMAEPGTHEGRQYRRVFATFGDPAPHADADHFVAWIDPDSGRIRFLQYTFRRMLESYRGCIEYDDWRPAGAFVLPHRHRIGTQPGDGGYYHTFTIEAWRLGPEAKTP